ncbi:MAG TPA: hypothetical protein VLF88_00445 [Candidatus Babeliales bacterium]|nr:hypothetical protein [Candidatus Babeliales bacterium]
MEKGLPENESLGFVENVDLGFEDDGLPDQKFFDLLNSAGNHEAKLLTAMVILSSPELSFSAWRIYREMIERQGSQVEWNVDRKLPIQYCSRSLEPIGTVVKGEVTNSRGNEVTVYSASEFGRMYGLGFCEVALGWSLDYPELPLIDVFGATNSKGDVRSPEVRYQIYKILLDKPDGISVKELRDRLDTIGYEGLSDIKKKVSMIAQNGLVTYQSKSSKHNPTFELASQDAMPSELPHSDRSIETKAVYAALRALGSEDETIVSLDQIIGMVTNLNPEADLVRVRRILIAAYAKDGSFPVLSAYRRTSGERSNVKLNPDYKKAISELVERLEHFRQEPIEFLHAQKAGDIINNPELFSQLMAKARNSSRVYRSHTEPPSVFHQEMIAISTEVGPISISGLQRLLKSKFNRKMSADAIRETANRLAESGELTVKDLQPDSSKKRTRRFFSATQ